MIQALGYCETLFTPSRPGRLCRGRERWIEPWPAGDPSQEPDKIHRTVVSGASFEDDSASRASRGIPFSGLSVPAILQALFPRRKLIAFCEDGHPADIPDKAEDVEMFSGYRAGGRSEELRVRWLMPVSGVRDLREAVGPDAEPRIAGLVWPKAEVARDDPALLDGIFALTGMSTVDSPPARFQPAALPSLLERCRAVVLLHRDKHGPVVGVYSHEPLAGAVGRLLSLCESEGTLPVKFAIPPMLARWDRALGEARSAWLEARDDPFPVPAAPRSERPLRRDHRGELSERARRQSRKARGEE